jgi:transcription elongation factor GreA-like protein
MAKSTKGLDVDCNMTGRYASEDCETIDGRKTCLQRVGGSACEKLKSVLLTTSHKYEMCMDQACTDKIDIPDTVTPDRLGEYYDAFKKYKAAEDQFQTDASQLIERKVIGKGADGQWKIIDPSSLDGEQSVALEKKLAKANANQINFSVSMTQKYDIEDHFNAALGMLDCCADTKCKIALKEKADINLAPDENSSSGK